MLNTQKCSLLRVGLGSSAGLACTFGVKIPTFLTGREVPAVSAPQDHESKCSAKLHISHLMKSSVFSINGFFISL